jgi:hypothetical protein
MTEGIIPHSYPSLCGACSTTAHPWEVSYGALIRAVCLHAQVYAEYHCLSIVYSHKVAILALYNFLESALLFKLEQTKYPFINISCEAYEP